MAEPRFKKAMEGGDKSSKKKPMYLRLGYTENPRKRVAKKTEPKPECPGGKRNCRDCEGLNIISPETLLRKEPEEKSGAEDSCGECLGVDCSAQGVSCAGKE